MRYTQLGRTGLQVSRLVLGTMNFGAETDEAGSHAIMDTALDAGINFFDTADIYGRTKSEEFLGQALGRRRGEIVLATKFGMMVDEGRQGARPEYVRQALDDSLRRLGTDYVDLYQIHQPDETVPIADTLGALDDAVKAGKEAAVRPGGARFVSVQNEYSLFFREPEQGVLAECERLDVAFIPFFPLASGLLTGKYRLGQPVPQGTRLTEDSYASELDDKKLATVEALIAFAEARGHTLLELAFSWLLARPAVASVIAGATKPEQVRANATAAGWRLTTEEMAEVDGILG
jgi:aryl-alcohol dehydrogenase-like predicted oxidoreductase